MCNHAILRGRKDNVSHEIRDANTLDAGSPLNHPLFGVGQTDGDRIVSCWFTHSLEDLLPMFDNSPHEVVEYVGTIT